MQPELFDLRKQLYLAIEADCAIVGNHKAVGLLLWPKLKPEAAQRRMSNALNVNQKQEFSPLEILKIKQAARDKAGRSNLHELESSRLEFKGQWLTAADRARLAFDELREQATAMQETLKKVNQFLDSQGVVQ